MTHSQFTKCLNCQQELKKSDKFCFNCGQANRENNLNFKYLGSEFLSANFNLDSKIYLTLKLLITSPASLTKAFLKGKRTKYITPIRLYLIISLVYFFVLSFSSYEDNIGGDSMINFSVNDTLTGQAVSDNVGSLSLGETPKNPIIMGDNNKQAFSDIIDSLEASNRRTTNTEGITLEDSSWIIQENLVPKLRKLNTESGRQDFWKQLTEYASIGMFLLMPFSALLLFGLFSSKSYYIQHLILTLHMHSLAFLLFTFFNLLEMVISWSYFDTIEISILIVIVYLWLKSFYNLSWGKAIWKTILFLILYVIILFIVFVIILAFNFFNF